MKKIVLTLVAMMAVTVSFAKSNEADKRFDMSCDIYRLSVVLDLDERQMDAVEDIHDKFTSEMQSLASLEGHPSDSKKGSTPDAPGAQRQTVP